jgi:DNA-binding phage protein
MQFPMIRIGLMALALMLGVYGLACTIAELSAAPRPAFPRDPTKMIAPTGDVSAWGQIASLIRSDLASDDALIAARRAIARGRTGSAAAEYADTRSRVRQTLSAAPDDPGLWLALALLETQQDPNGPAALEALKMAYFTAPSDAGLTPVRLDTATRSDVLTDPDLAELARGDVRLILTQRPELRAVLVQAYRRASKHGQAFLEQAVGATDPAFIATLRG